MPPVELDNTAIKILNNIVLREKYESLSDAIRHLDNKCTLQGVVITKQENEIDKLEHEKEHENKRLRNVFFTMLDKV